LLFSAVTKKELLELIPRPDKSTVNVGLRTAKPAELIALLGNPRDSYTGTCQPVTNATLKAAMSTTSVGNFKVTGHRAATAALKEIFKTVHTELPDLHALVGTAGMLCARRVKLKTGLGKNPSNHSWGLAIDLKLDGKLNAQGDNLTERGLLILARYFNAAGWYWGVSFPTEDAMHFEVSHELLKKWKKDGVI
jgi:hypothetical protein